MQALVSIVIPCYNDGDFLSEAVASAQAQSYAACEIIVVNDYSNDARTLQILQELEGEKVRVITTAQGQKGTGAARNTGIAAAQGKYILPLDADDKIDPNYVEKAVAIMEARPEVGICYVLTKYFGLKQGVEQAPPFDLVTMLYSNFIPCTGLFHKRDWETVGGYDTESLVEDYSLWISILSLGRQVHRIDEPLFFYRKRKNSRVMGLRDEQRRGRALKQLYEKNRSFYQGHGLPLYLTLCSFSEREKAQQRLLSYKLLKPLMRLEAYAITILKKIMGRA